MKIINLLPKNKRENLRYESIFAALVRFLTISAMTFILVFVLQFGVKVYLQYRSGVVQTQIENIQKVSSKQENADLKLQIKGINSEIADFTKLARETPKWSKVLRAFATLVPSNVTINSFDANIAKKTVDITGFSPTREAVIDLYHNIRRDEANFYNIDYPLENVSKPTDISFHFSFSIKDELFK